MSDKFGMMDNAYFTSKSEILKWLNTTLKLNITKVEQASTGAIYCQLLDALHPNKVKLQKVNWKATLEHEFLANLKLLQQSLIDLGIDKEIDISKLAKGRYQDNFEMAIKERKAGNFVELLLHEEEKTKQDYEDYAKRNRRDKITYMIGE